jgi:hypothetical protein
MASARLCARPARGIIVGLDSVAGFSTHSTLGALRSRYGFAVVDGPYARSCKFPYLRFALASNDTARRVPDSARVSRIDMTGADTTIRRFCLTHLPVSER